MRPDKATLLGVAATLGLYRAGRAESSIPVWRMIAASVDELRSRAAAVVDRVGERASVIELDSTIGGGSLPGQTLPSAGVAIAAGSAHRFLAGVRRSGRISVIGRIEAGRAVFDLRTVEPERDEALAAILSAALDGRP
jgi:L-seryl-tRNA(Ser) seleniumtransferase